ARGGARANAAEQRVALREHTRILAARSSTHRPQSGHELVEMRAAQRRRALHQVETVGREHAEQGALLALQRALERGAVAGNHLLGAPLPVNLQADAQLMPFALILDPHHDARRAGAEAHQLAIVARARGARCAGEVDRLQEVGLPRAVGPVHDRQARAELCVGAGVGAKVAHLHAEHPHGGAAQTLRRMGMIRYTKSPPSGDSISPGRRGFISFSTSSSDSTLSSPSRRNSGLKPISKRSPANGTGIASLASPTSGVCADTVSVPSLKLSRSGAFLSASTLMRRTTSVSSAVARRSSCSTDSGKSWR